MFLVKSFGVEGRRKMFSMRVTACLCVCKMQRKNLILNESNYLHSIDLWIFESKFHHLHYITSDKVSEQMEICFHENISYLFLKQKWNIFYIITMLNSYRISGNEEQFVTYFVPHNYLPVCIIFVFWLLISTS